MDQRIAVVGAGYAGMAAAATLAQQGIRVTVLESGPVPGGRARRVVTQGTELDNGQHIVVGAYTELFRLMALVGVPGDALLRMPLELRYADGFCLRALWLPFPFNVLGAFLLARRLPFAERLGAVRFMAAMHKAGFHADPGLTVEALLAAHRQDRLAGHYVWRPLCVSALNTPPEQASASAFLVVLRDAVAGGAEASDLLLPRVDLSRLFPEPAARYVEAKGGEIRLGTTVRTLEGLRKDFAAVIIAVGPHQLKVLLPELAPDYAYQPIYTCYLQYPEATRLPFPMLGMAGGLVQWVFDRGALTGEKGRFACVISAQGDHQQMALEEVAARCHAELATAIPKLPAPLWHRTIAERRATVACVPGSPRPAAQTPIPGVFLAGDYTDPDYPPTLEAAVRSGVRAARLAAARVGERRIAKADAPVPSAAAS